LLTNHPRARIVGVSAFSNAVPDKTAVYASLREMLSDPAVELVSLCSPRRSEQADHAIQCLRSGRHVYAEKPCALNEADLDRIEAAAKETGKVFREMAGTAFTEPYASLREIAASGRLGEIVQVFAQKSYPYHDGRPQDESVDGGLLLQAGIHAFRMVEHAAGVRIGKVSSFETTLGNPNVEGGLRMAASIAMTLQNGGTAAILINYLNPHGHGKWGNEHLRIFGTKGFVESTDGGMRTRLVIGQEDLGEVPLSKDRVSYFDMLLGEIIDGTRMPITLAEELSPLRAALRAKRAVVLP